MGEVVGMLVLVGVYVFTGWMCFTEGRAHGKEALTSEHSILVCYKTPERELCTRTWLPLTETFAR